MVMERPRPLSDPHHLTTVWLWPYAAVKEESAEGSLRQQPDKLAEQCGMKMQQGFPLFYLLNSGQIDNVYLAILSFKDHF